jgi:endonuclease/exonuclease/phosphatase family metal-dependent hydrolase
MVTIAQSGTNTGGYDSLLDALGRRYWDGVITETAVPNPVTSNSEYYSFVFRKSAVSSCAGSKVQRLPDPEDVFIREPAWACFKLKAHPRELVVAAYHALFGSPVERKREVGFLDDDLDRNGKPDDLFAAMKASRSGNPDVLLLGDFNLGSSELAQALPRYVDLTNGKGSTINTANQVTANQYDHAVVPSDSPLIGKTAPAETLDVRKVVTGDAYFSTVSDHLPIRLIIK